MTRALQLGVALAMCIATAAVMAISMQAVSTRTVAPDGDEVMKRAAAAFMESLSSEQREQAVIEFDDPNRFDWHFVPRQGRGIVLRDLTDEQRLGVHDLLRSALSSRGYLKTTGIIHLEDVLRDMESARGRRADHRDPDLYRVSIFGDPGRDEPWGWRIEGHHLSLNFTSITHEPVAVTPSFFGANPAEVRFGPKAGLRILAAEEDLARQLLLSLDEAQREQAIIAAVAPRDIIMGPDRDRLPFEPQGLAAGDMNDEQRAALRLLIEEYARNLQPRLADKRLARIDEAGFDAIRFAWAGAINRGEPHYYRLHGPTFIIEYDNVQNNANHVHTVWRDLENDFGRDLLREHHERRHHPADGEKEDDPGEFQP